MKPSRKLLELLPRHNICRGLDLKSYVTTIVSSESFADSSRAGIVERHRAVCTEPHASRRICRSVRQQSLAVFKKFWQHKVMNSFN